MVQANYSFYIATTQEIDNAYEITLDTMQDLDDIDVVKLEEFADFVLDTLVGDACFYSRSIWNHYDNLSDPRTNNHVEGFHSKLSKIFTIFTDKKPNIWLFIEKIKRIDTSNTLYLELLSNGKLKDKNRRSNKDLNRDIHIKTQMREFAEQRITLDSLSNNKQKKIKN